MPLTPKPKLPDTSTTYYHLPVVVNKPPATNLQQVPMDVDIHPPNTTVGIYIGSGVNNGRVVWRGPKNGLFLRNRNDTRIAVSNRNLVQFF